MIIENASFFTERDLLFLDLRLTDKKEERRITSETLLSINARILITPVNQETYKKVEELYIKIRKDQIKFENNRIIIETELNRIHEPSCFKINLKVLIFALDKGEKVEVPILKSYYLSDIISKERINTRSSINNEASDIQNIQLDDSRNKNKEVALKPLNTNTKAKTPFYKLKLIDKISAIGHIVNSEIDANAIESMQEIEFEATSLDVQEVLIEIVYSLLKMIIELNSLKSLKIKELLGKYFRKFFSQYVSSGVK